MLLMHLHATSGKKMLNLVLLSKRHSHAKAVDILMAFQEEGLCLRGIIALTPPRPPFPISRAMQKLYERVCLAKNPVSRRLPLLADQRTASGCLDNEKNSSWGESNGDARAAHSKLVHKSALTLDAYAWEHGIPVIHVNDLNGTKCVQALQDFQTGILVLGGVPIVRKNVLAVPQAGTLNVHMGWLPGMRGMNAAEWSIFLDKPVAVSVHLVDAGIDTGTILHREKFEISDCHSLAEMRKQLSAFQHRVLARATRLFIAQRLRPIPQRPEEGKQYYSMHPRLRALVEKKLCAGYVNPAGDFISRIGSTCGVNEYSRA